MNEYIALQTALLVSRKMLFCKQTISQYFQVQCYILSLKEQWEYFKYIVMYSLDVIQIENVVLANKFI